MGLTDLVSLNFNILESGAFNDLHNLRTLKLQENKFDEINVEIFNKLAYVDDLDLSWNSITEFDRHKLAEIRTLKE